MMKLESGWEKKGHFKVLQCCDDTEGNIGFVTAFKTDLVGSLRP